MTTVLESGAACPGTPILHRAKELGITTATLQSILTKDLHHHIFKTN